MSARPLLLGHRGCRARGLQRHTSSLPFENSLAAFEYALSRGCDGFEFDVRHSSDGRNVLWHDPDWNGLPIAATKYGDLADRTGPSLATFEDVLTQFGHRAYLDIELKVPGNEAGVVAALGADPPKQGFIVTSFYPEVLFRLRELNGALPLGFLCDSADALDVWPELPVQTILPRYDFVRRRLIDQVHDRGRKVMTWTVNSPRQMRQFAKWGTDGLISDDPQLLYQTFHSE